MFDAIVQFLAMSLLLTGLWIMGNKRLTGPALTTLAEVFTTIVGITHHTWSITVVGVVLSFVQARNFLKWRKEGARW
jgi:hypothetical protein